MVVAMLVPHFIPTMLLVYQGCNSTVHDTSPPPPKKWYSHTYITPQQSKVIPPIQSAVQICHRNLANHYQGMSIFLTDTVFMTDWNTAIGKASAELQNCEQNIGIQCDTQFEQSMQDFVQDIKTVDFSQKGCPDNFVVHLDIGHSAISSGARSSHGVPEYKFNKNLVQKIEQALHHKKIAFQTLDAGNQNVGFAARRMKAEGASILISIHHDSVQEHFLSNWIYAGSQQHYCDKFAGHSVFISDENAYKDQNMILATYVATELKKLGQPTTHHAQPIKGENRNLVRPELGIYEFSALAMLQAPLPSILIEAGVIVNRMDEKKLSSSLYQNKMAFAIATGVQHYCHQYK